MGKILDGYPWWSQLTDPNPATRRPDVFATTDCGEEVVSIWVAGQTGQYTDASHLRQQLGGGREDGRTTAEDLVMLLGWHEVRARSEMVSPTAVKPAVRASIDEHSPVALLGRWIVPDVLHWILGVGYGNDALLGMDPWTGHLVAYRWTVVRSLATGTLVRQEP